MIAVIYSSIYSHTKTKFENIATQVLELNEEVTEIKSIHQIGHWGEWFSEYVLIVVMNEGNYRVWVNEIGEITASERI